MTTLGAQAAPASPEPSPPPPSASWTPSGATDVWTVSWTDEAKSRVYGVTIENFDGALANVRLVQSTLRDASGQAIGVDRLSLVDRPDAAPRAGIDVPANSARTVFLRLDAGAGGGPFGTFDGIVRFAADGSPAMKDVPLKVQASSCGRRVFGVILTLIGLLLTYVVSAIARPQMARLQARRAAASVRQAIANFGSELGTAVPEGVPTPSMKAVASRLALSVSDEALDRAGLLPRGFGLWPGAESSAEPSVELQAKLDEVSRVLAGLWVLLRSGFPRLLRLWATDPEAALPLLHRLDDYADRLTGPEDARAEVDGVLASIRTTREVGAPPSGREVSLVDLDFRIENLSRWAWGIWALVALAIGVGWIAGDPDYGTPLDLVSSFLWGFGLTTFGAGLQNLTPGSVSTHLNLRVPK